VGPTVLDVSVVIGWMDGADSHHEAAGAVLADSRLRGDRL